MSKPYQRITSCERIAKDELKGWDHNFARLYANAINKDEGEMGLRLMTDWFEYHEFIERLARTELVQTSCADEYCPCCEAANTPIDDNNYVHLHGCIVVEARQLLGLTSDEAPLRSCVKELLAETAWLADPPDGAEGEYE